MSTRLQRLRDLQKATRDYVSKERTRLENEAQVLKDVLDGRTARRGIQALSTSVVSAAAEKDLASYLRGG